ncbi:hypothetical protein LB505_006880 [Fusarium chuoi]|nr:hypothetical protein LB505_006880 [Fusarium chuoi]
METPEVPQDALRLNALAAQNANVSRTVYAHASERSATTRQKLDDASEDPVIKRRCRDFTAINYCEASNKTAWEEDF